MIRLLHNRLVRLQRWLARATEDRIYADEGAIQFQLPKGLDPRDSELWEKGQRYATRIQEERDRLLAIQPVDLAGIQADYDQLWKHYL